MSEYSDMCQPARPARVEWEGECQSVGQVGPEAARSWWNTPDASMRRLHLLDRDLLCGVLFVALGAATLFYARQYPLGSLTDMGPGYFPTILGAALVIFGATIGIGSLD